MEKLNREYFQAPGSTHLAPDDQLMDLFGPEPQLLLEGHTRLKIWEVQERFKCPVIGWCLEIAEQKELLRKEGIFIRDKSNFEIHEIVVESLGEESHLSRRIDSWLNRKYRKEIRELSPLHEEEFIRHWNASLRKGEVEGILWVAVTKTDLSREVNKIIFGDMHMEMHVRAKQIGNERQRLDQEAKRNEILTEGVREVNRTNRILKKENEGLRNEWAMACRLSDSLRGQNQELRSELLKVNENDWIASLQTENAELRARRDEILRQISVYERELRKLQNQNSKLRFKLKKQWQARIHQSNEAESPIDQNAGLRLHDPVSSRDLSQRCILLVGGLPQMEPHYRRLIEGNKGVFEYHDGRMNGGAKELVGRVRRADFVLCCLDHTSHTAALVVRKLCKKQKKPFQMLLKSSLNNIFSALLAVQANIQSNLSNHRSREIVMR